MKLWQPARQLILDVMTQKHVASARVKVVASTRLGKGQVLLVRVAVLCEALSRRSMSLLGSDMNTKTQIEPFPYNSPPWRRSHRAVSPNGSIVAEIAEAFEHSMSNPTVGTLRTSDGLELPNCSPAFIWSDDSQYVAVPQWCWRFGLFRRQRPAIIALADRAVYVSKFTTYLMQPATFDRGRLEALVSNSRGISWPWKEEHLVLEVPGYFRHLPE